MDYARDKRCELIDGKVVAMSPDGGKHGGLELRIMGPVVAFAGAHRLGWGFGPSTGFVLGRRPDAVLQPDRAFVALDRLAEEPDEFVELAPDLVLEVGSPHDRAGEVRAKVLRWLEAGVRVVWVAYPKLQRIDVWSSPNELHSLGRHDTLTCEELLPGFALPLSDVFRADQ